MTPFHLAISWDTGSVVPWNQFYSQDINLRGHLPSRKNKLLKTQNQLLFTSFYDYKCNNSFLFNYMTGVQTCALPICPVQLFVTPWTVACQAPRSMGFSRQEYWSGVPFPSLDAWVFPKGASHFLDFLDKVFCLDSVPWLGCRPLYPHPHPVF